MRARDATHLEPSFIHRRRLHVAASATAVAAVAAIVLRWPKINIKIKGRKEKKKTYQRLETCRVSSPCWHPAAAAIATVAVVAVDAAVVVVVVVAIIVAVIVVVKVAVVIIIAKTKNKYKTKS